MNTQLSDVTNNLLITVYISIDRTDSQKHYHSMIMSDRTLQSNDRGHSKWIIPLSGSCMYLLTLPNSLMTAGKKT